MRFWGPSGQHLAELARKGVEVFVEGKLRENRWVDSATDEERSMLYLKGSWWQFTQYRTPRGGDPIEGDEETPQPKAEPQPPPAATAEPATVPPAKRKMSKRTQKTA